MKVTVTAEFSIDYPEQELKNYQSLAAKARSKEIGQALLNLVEISQTRPLTELVEAFEKVRRLEYRDDKFTAFLGDTLHRLLKIGYAMQADIAAVLFPSFCDAMRVDVLNPLNYRAEQCSVVVTPNKTQGHLS